MPVSVFIHVHQAPLYGFYDVQFGAVGLVGERVVCVRACVHITKQARWLIDLSLSVLPM